jgi:hypothetical protein
MTKPKIYVFPVHANPQGDCAYMAVAEDGEEVAGHISSSEDWGKFDMGVNAKSTQNHDAYRKKYPDGYELEYVPDWKAHPFLSKQAEANKNAGVGQTEQDIT